MDAVLFRDRYPADDGLEPSLDTYDETYRAYLAQRGADPIAWTRRMSDLHAAPRRAELAAYYTAKGARLD